MKKAYILMLKDPTFGYGVPLAVFSTEEKVLGNLAKLTDVPGCYYVICKLDEVVR